MHKTEKHPIFLVLLLLAVFFFFPACGETASDLSPTSSSVVLIEGGTLIDGTAQAPTAGIAILIEDGRIRQIGKQGELNAPAGAQVIQADDKYIIPGLIDPHVHYNAPFLHRLYLANGVTTVRDLGSPIDRMVTLREEIAVGNILGPRIFVSGRPGSASENVKEVTRKMIEAGVDGFKITNYTFDELKDIVEVAHAHGLKVYGHTGPTLEPGRRGPGARRAVEGGIDGIEHATDFMEGAIDQYPPLPADFDPSNRGHLYRYYYGQLYKEVNSSKVDSLIQMMVENDVYFSPTIVTHYRVFGQRNTPELAADPALKYMPEKYDRDDRYGVFGPEEREEWRKTLDLWKEITYKFHQAGGLLVPGADSQAGAPDGSLPGWSLHQEMELFVEAGLTPMQALQTATLNSAKVLGKETELGTVENGKYADLVILDANPLEDISNTQKIHLVIREGMVLDPEVLLEENIKQFGERRER